MEKWGKRNPTKFEEKLNIFSSVWSQKFVTSFEKYASDNKKYSRGPSLGCGFPVIKVAGDNIILG